MKKAYIFHGWQGNSQENWLPWLKEQLEKEGFKVIVPDFPDSDNPDLESWLNFLKTEKCDFDKNTVLIGHSLGAVLALRLLERQKIKVNSVYLIAVFDEDLGIPELKKSEFFDLAFNWDKIKKRASKFHLINSDNDKYVLPKFAEKLSWDLEIYPRIMLGKGHFNTFKEFSELLSLIKENEL